MFWNETNNFLYPFFSLSRSLERQKFSKPIDRGIFFPISSLFFSSKENGRRTRHDRIVNNTKLLSAIAGMKALSRVVRETSIWILRECIMSLLSRDFFIRSVNGLLYSWYRDILLYTHFQSNNCVLHWKHVGKILIKIEYQVYFVSLFLFYNEKYFILWKKESNSDFLEWRATILLTFISAVFFFFLHVNLYPPCIFRRKFFLRFLPE